MPSCGASTPNMRTPCTSSNAKSLAFQGRVDQLEELNKRLTEERDQFLERYYRLVTQFELIGGGVDRARAGVSERGRPEKHEPRELPSLPAAKSLSNANGQLEDGIAKITATLGGEHRSSAE